MSRQADKNNTMNLLLFLVLGIGSLVSLSVYMLVRNAQAASEWSSSTMGPGGEIASNSNDNSRDLNQKDNTAKQMGICVVGAGGPCNGDSNWDGTHDVNGQCVLLNGCAKVRGK